MQGLDAPKAADALAELAGRLDVRLGMDESSAADPPLGAPARGRVARFVARARSRLGFRRDRALDAATASNRRFRPHFGRALPRLGRRAMEREREP